MATANGSRRPKRRRETLTAATAVADALALYGVGEQVRAHRIVTEWKDLVGERIAARTWPDGLSRRVLWVRVSSSAWLHELTLLRDRILADVNNALGTPHLVAELKFHLGTRKASDTSDLLAGAAVDRRRGGKPARPLPPPAAGPALTRIVDETAAVEDDELRTLIRSVRTRHDR